MLDVDEPRFAVGGEGNARYFAFLGAHAEAAYLFADGVGAQHLLVALAFIVAAVAVLAVGLYPQSAGTVEGSAVGAVAGFIRPDVCGGRLRVGAVGVCVRE